MSAVVFTPEQTAAEVVKILQMPDIKALCKGIAKGRRRTVQCLRENEAKLSTTCKKSLQVAP